MSSRDKNKILTSYTKKRGNVNKKE